ncbi:hypothetical protein P7C70_g8318, partial [Phenoliferia sp. Uapishka_3]
ETASLHPHFHQSLDEDTLAALTERGTPVTLTRRRSGSVTNHSPTSRRPKTRSAVRPSLLGAIEFRDVVNSLRADSSARTLAVFGGGEGHGHASHTGADLSPSRRMSRSNSYSEAPTRPTLEAAAMEPLHHSVDHIGLIRAREGDPNWTAEMGGLGPAFDGGVCEADHGHWGESEDEEGGGAEGPLIDLSAGVENPWQASWGRRSLKVDIPVYSSSATSPRTIRRKQSSASIASVGMKPVPSIRLTTATGDVSELAGSPKPSFFSLHHRRSYQICRAVFLALFPSLQDFSEKSWVGKATAVLCVPAILMLNLTLPVVDIEDEDCASVESRESDGMRTPVLGLFPEGEGETREGTLIDLEEGTTILHQDHQHHQHQPPQRTRRLSDADLQSRADRKAVTTQFHSAVVPHPEPDTPSPWATPAELNAFKFPSPSIPPTPAPGYVEDLGKGEVDLNVNESVLTRWLTAVQCTLGPVFCVTALFG